MTLMHPEGLGQTREDIWYEKYYLMVNRKGKIEVWCLDHGDIELGAMGTSIVMHSVLSCMFRHSRRYHLRGKQGDEGE